MDKNIESGQAFPSAGTESGWSVDGMSLRDYFAAQALIGLLANAHHFSPVNPTGYANLTYEFADAMVAAREK